MNRIAGILNLDRAPVSPEDVNNAFAGIGSLPQAQPLSWVDQNLGFSCISMGNGLEQESPRSPYLHPNQKWAIALDGRIDNRDELVRLLGSRIKFSMEAVLLAGYEKWGLDLPKHLIGDFAFAIWDKNQQRLLCARDHFGVKPLYYYFSKEVFLFASTPASILSSGRVPLQIHEERIADHLVNPLEGVDKACTFYQDIFRLPPAHMLIVQPSGMRLERYWELSPALDTGIKSNDEYVAAFQDLFAEAVRCRVQDGTVTAAMLSGGMDSSAITGMARKIFTHAGGPALKTFSAISNSPDTNRETSHIHSILNWGNLHAHLISEKEVLERMDELVKTIECEPEPFDCLMNLNRAIYLHARDRDINAVLDGIDGDNLLSGSGHLLQLWREGDLRAVIQETFQAGGLTAEYKMGRSMFINSLLASCLPPVPGWLRKLRRPHRYRRIVSAAIKDSIIDPDFATRSNLSERFMRLHSHAPKPSPSTQQEFHRNSLDHPFLTVGLERYERVANSFGIEARHPFTDVRLAEFCLGLPWHLKTRRGWTKFILRRAMERELPADVVWRRDKDSLMWEFNRLILKSRAEYFHQATLDERENLKPYLDVVKLESFWKEYLINKNEKHSEQIWLGLALAFWLRYQKITLNLSLS